MGAFRTVRKPHWGLVVVRCEAMEFLVLAFLAVVAILAIAPGEALKIILALVWVVMGAWCLFELGRLVLSYL